MSISEWVLLIAALVVALIVALLIALRIVRRDPLLRSVRLGVYLERERFDDLVDDDAYQRTYPPE